MSRCIIFNMSVKNCNAATPMRILTLTKTNSVVRMQRESPCPRVDGYTKPRETVWSRSA